MKTSSMVFVALLVAVTSWSTEVGTVRLPLAEYQRLLAAAKPPEVSNSPPVRAGWVNSDYALSVRGESIHLVTTLEAVSWSDRRCQLQLPELGAVYQATFVTGSGSIQAKDGTRYLNLRGRGRVRLQVESVPEHGRDGDRAWVTFGVADASANRLTGSLPEGNADVTLTGGVLSVKAPALGAVDLIAQLERGATAKLYWALAAREAPKAALVATASLARLYILGDDELTLAGRLEVEVLRGALDRVTITAPADLRPTSAIVADNTVTSFDRDPQDPTSVQLVLGRPVTSGSVRIFWSFVSPFQLTAGVVTLPELELTGFPRGESVAAVTSRKPIVVTSAAPESAGYDRIDEGDLPPDFRAIIDRPVLYAARRRAGGSPALALNLGVFPDAPTLDGVIDRAEFLSVLKADGRRVDRTRLELQSRESVLRLPLPDGAQVWSVMLDGATVRPLTEDGKLLVPLGRGRASLGGRVIEYVTNTATSPLDDSVRGVGLSFPELPLPASLVSWQLWLPDGLRYRFRSGTLTETLTAAQEWMSPQANGQVVVGNRTNAIYGKAVDPAGGVLPGVLVTAKVLGSKEGTQTRTDGSGNFVVAGLASGPIELILDLAGFAETRQTVVVPAGAAISVTVTVHPRFAETVEVTSGASRRERKSRKAAVAVMPEPLLADVVTVSSTEVTGGEESHRVAAESATAPPGAPPSPPLVQNTFAAGVASIPVELPTSGKLIRLEGLLLIDQSASVELERKREKKRKRK